MKKRSKVLSRRQLPTRLPIYQTAIAALVLDRFSAPGWVWGVAAGWCAILWIGSIALCFEESQIELEELKDWR